MDDRDHELKEPLLVPTTSATPHEEKIEEIQRRWTENQAGTPKKDGKDTRETFAARRIFINDESRGRNDLFISNRVITSKYNLFTFLPKFLGHTFSKAVNLYFLFVCVLQVIPGISNTYGIPIQAFPLAMVIVVDAVFQIMEDMARHKDDTTSNRRTTLKLSSNYPGIDKIEIERATQAPFTCVYWEDVRVGDLIKLQNYERVPADMVILYTSPTQYCYVETMSLDGETNLKIKQSLRSTRTYLEDTKYLDFHQTFCATLECELPNDLIHKFSGILHLRTSCYDGTWTHEVINDTNMLLRGCVLRNTGFVYGLVINTGHDTKVMQAAKECPSKVSSIDEKLDGEFVWIATFLFLFCCAAATLASCFNAWVFDSTWYLSTEGSTFVFWFASFFRFFLILSNVVPISLYVTLDVVKSLQSYFITHDKKMYHDETDTVCQVKTMALNEDLGRISYIFTDKTGTLTCNVMNFNRCCIAGISYGNPMNELPNQSIAIDAEEEEEEEEHEKKSTKQATRARARARRSTPVAPPAWINFSDDHFDEKVTSNDAQVHEFLLHLALCHSVLPELNQHNQVMGLSASSPDEQALVAFASLYGYEFCNRSPGAMYLKQKSMDGRQDNLLTFELLQLFEFTSERKRMSVMVRDPHSKQILMYTKGADSVLLERLDMSRPSNHVMKEQSILHLAEYAKLGLRTLVQVKREFTEASYARFEVEYRQALLDYHQVHLKENGQPNRIDDLINEIESSFDLVGVTAIEDKLQNGVSETIEALRLAGIKIWMLTGDHPETAKNIAFSTQLIHSTMEVFMITKQQCFHAQDFKDRIRAYAEQISRITTSPSCLVSSTLEKKDDLNHLKASTLTRNDCLRRPNVSASIPASAWKKEKHKKIEKIEKIDTNLLHSSSLPALFGSGVALIIDGDALEFALNDVTLRVSFVELLSKASMVVACRTSPGQKAQLVRFVKDWVMPSTTQHEGNLGRCLAIGDGANDVPMLQEADVGVGVFGKEGRQASNASDYSVGQFRFLKRLLLVHGRFNHQRVAVVVHYIFYKNVLVEMSQLWYSLLSGMSGPTFYNQWAMNLFNTLYTSVPIILVGVFDMDVPAWVSERLPVLYKPGIQGLAFQRKTIWRWIIAGLFESFAICIISVLALSTADRKGFTYGMWEIGAVAFTVVILVVNFKLAIYQQRWTIVEVSFMSASVLLWFISAFILSAGPTIDFNWFELFPNLMKSEYFWCILFIVPLIVLSKDIVVISYERTWRPTMKHILQERVNYPDFFKINVEKAEKEEQVSDLFLNGDVLTSTATSPRWGKELSGFAVSFDPSTSRAEAIVCRDGGQEIS